MLSRLINSRIPSAANRLRGKVNKQRGDNTEALVKNYLKSLGFGMVEKINTAFKPSYKNGKAAGGFYAEQASGDFRAVIGAGVSVLVEVKRREKAKLSLSDFEAHQASALSNHNALGGLSLVTWVTPSLELLLMRWPMPILAKGRPITLEEGRKLSSMTKVTLALKHGIPWQIADYGKLAVR